MKLFNNLEYLEKYKEKNMFTIYRKFVIGHRKLRKSNERISTSLTCSPLNHTTFNKIRKVIQQFDPMYRKKLLF